MTSEAKIAVLKQAAERKRQDALDRTNQAIAKLGREGKKITFAAIAEAAGVSVAYLYKYDELKERIDHLRKQQQKAEQSIKPQPASDKSKLVIVNQFKVRINELEAKSKILRDQNKSLHDQNEVIYGRLCQLQSIQQEVETLKTQNASLKAENDRLRQLGQTHSPKHNEIPSTAIPNSNVTLFEKKRSDKSGITDQIQLALADVGVKINPTLTKTIQAAPEATVLAAIDALKEALTTENVKRPGGWLNRAIQGSWDPNASLCKYSQAATGESFRQWFDLAKAKGLVVASTKGGDGQMYVYDQQGICYPFEQISEQFPSEILKNDPKNRLIVKLD